MDNLKGNIAPRNDLPGSLDFVFRYIDANFDGAGTASTITDLSLRKTLCIMLFSPQFSHMAHQHQQAKHQQW